MVAWTKTARLLHWGTALAVLVEVPAGLIMTWTYRFSTTGGAGAQLHLRSSQVHHTLGLLLLAMVFFRIFWRLRHPAPALPQDVGPIARIAAGTVQVLLYGLLFALPLSGWAALSVMAAGAGYPAPSLWFFTQDGFGPGGWIPHIVAPRPWNARGLLNYGAFAHLHLWSAWIGGGLLVLHVAGALYHHFIRRDGVLSRLVSG
jgi:cytochrome b561